VPRARLIASVFGVVRANESHRARLRVEVGRLRKLLEGLVGIQADEHGFGLTLRGTGKSKASVVVLSPLDDGQDAALRSLLADGAAWSSSGLALALGSSQRSVQRALATLEANGEAHSVGRGRAQRWLSRLGTTSAAYPAI
jgi:carbon monoxide dehydrogenase subunit G